MRARVGATLLAGLGAAILFGLEARAVRRDLATPRELHGARFAGSNECRRCHPVHHESWSRTFHRTMTQEATDQSVLAAFDGRAVSYGGIDAHPVRSQGAFEISFRRAGREVRRVQVDRTVGSRRYQQYLATEGDTWFRLPLAWDVEENRWFHMNAAFLTPDPEGLEAGTVGAADYDRHVTRWNDNCVFCHNVGPDPGLDPATGRYATHVAELGIGCEACHGPGAEHVARNADPFRRYALHAGDAEDPTIVGPSRLTPERRADLCGRCHGQRITDDVAHFVEHGDPFVPGDDLALYSSPLWRDTTLGDDEGVFEARFWADGTPRLTAYEYQGWLQSRCAVEGRLTCTDCHGMHEGDPRGQLRPSMAGDTMCAGACHSALAPAEQARRHAGHDDVRCVDCHMPRIVFGVRDVHRSHRIEIPRPTRDEEHDRPDACTLCHLDRTTSWAQRAISERAAHANAGTGDAITAPPPSGELANDAGDSAAWRTALGGDPIARAVVISALGRSGRSARELGVLVQTMRDDPYPALRHLAWRAFRAGTALPPSAFDATAPVSARAESLATWLEGWPEPVEVLPRATLDALRAHAAGEAIEVGE